jgi:ABC-2 type transport system permease protein
VQLSSTTRGGSGFATAVLGLAFVVSGVGNMLGHVDRMRAEEADGRLEPVLAASVSRPRWLMSHILNAVLGALLLLFVFAVSMSVAAGLVLGDLPAELRALIGAALVHCPPDEGGVVNASEVSR